MTCTKTIYSSEALAKEDVIRIKNKSKRMRKPLSVYKCPHGEHWHLTSRDNTLKDKIAALEAELKKVNETREEWLSGLKGELAAAKLEFENYKKSYNQKERVVVRADERVKDLQKQLKQQALTISKLKNDKNTLFAQIVQLNNKIEILTKTNNP